LTQGPSLRPLQTEQQSGNTENGRFASKRLLLVPVRNTVTAATSAAENEH